MILLTQYKLVAFRVATPDVKTRDHLEFLDRFATNQIVNLILPYGI